MNIFLNINEINYGAIDAYDSACYNYYIIILSPSAHTFQADLNINYQVIYSIEKV